MSLAEEVTQLRQANAALQAEVSRLQGVISSLEAQLAELQGPPAPPPFVKPNKHPPPKQPRSKRDPAHNHGRRRATPSEVRTVAFDRCPKCAHHLYGHSIARRREVLDLPPPPPVTVIEFQVLKRYCPHCEKWREPELNLAGLVIGHGRVCVRIMALVAWLGTVLRLPIRQIQHYLATLHQLELSTGEICGLLNSVAAAGASTAAALKAELRAGPVLYMDETSWREAGQNGYAWVMTGASGASYFEYSGSRAGAVGRGLSGAHYAGTLCSDFYAGYNEHQCRHQRCWAHLVRDLTELEEAHAGDEQIVGWIGQVCQLYREGAALRGRAPPASASERASKAGELQARVHELGLEWARERKHPLQVLSQRLLRHEGELFEFVRQAEVEATNNRAERAIRPLAVARKISGGTRSERGSGTRMRLQTLFSSWAGKGLDPLQACLAMLCPETPLPSS